MKFRLWREGGRRGRRRRAMLQRHCVLRFKSTELLSWQAWQVCVCLWPSWELSHDGHSPSLCRMRWPLQNTSSQTPVLGCGFLHAGAWTTLCYKPEVSQVLPLFLPTTPCCVWWINFSTEQMQPSWGERRRVMLSISIGRELPRAVCAFECQISPPQPGLQSPSADLLREEPHLLPNIPLLWPDCSLGRQKLLALPSPLSFFPSCVLVLRMFKVDGFCVNMWQQEVLQHPRLQRSVSARCCCVHLILNKNPTKPPKLKLCVVL